MAITHCTIQKSGPAASSEEYLAAARQLTGAAFKLYIYFDCITNPVGQYTRAKTVDILKLSRHTLDAAFNELCERGYLQLNDNDVYIFLTKVEETT